MLIKDLHPIALVFEAVKKKLKDDPVLNRVIRKWPSVHPPEPKASDIPYCVVSMKAGETKVGSPNSQADTITVGIDYVVDASGQNEETAWIDIVNLYGLICDAIGPGTAKDWVPAAASKSNRKSSMNGDIRISVAGYSQIPLNGFNAICGQTIIQIPLKVQHCEKGNES